ncbi:hypothetical protein [uncultured Algoriphagus sp.]|uniref:hypothetical protein n=1 Tax=uncultured Algoriphagus sp. TaxID=417365 RepID=UPI0030ED2DD6
MLVARWERGGIALSVFEYQVQSTKYKESSSKYQVAKVRDWKLEKMGFDFAQPDTLWSSAYCDCSLLTDH